MNNKYTIRFEHPLVRPGITIVTEASERYVVAVIQKGLELIRCVLNFEIRLEIPRRPKGEWHA